MCCSKELNDMEMTLNAVSLLSYSESLSIPVCTDISGGEVVRALKQDERQWIEYYVQIHPYYIYLLTQDGIYRTGSDQRQ